MQRRVCLQSVGDDSLSVAFGSLGYHLCFGHVLIINVLSNIIYTTVYILFAHCNKNIFMSVYTCTQNATNGLYTIGRGR